MVIYSAFVKNQVTIVRLFEDMKTEKPANIAILIVINFYFSLSSTLVASI